MIVLRIDPCARVDQFFQDWKAQPSRGFHQRSLTVIISDINIPSGRKQIANQIGTRVVAEIHERCPGISISRVHIGSRGQQHLHHLAIAVLDRVVDSVCVGL